jgi:hypothetical protein
MIFNPPSRIKYEYHQPLKENPIMQIREQGKQVQLIRSPYDKTKKRCVQKVAHIFPRQYFYSSDDITTYLSAEQIADLSDDEKKTLSDWLKGRADKSAADNRRNRIISADISLSALADAILSDGVTDEQAAAIVEGLAKVAKALKKSGHKSSKKKPEAPAPAVVPPGQEGLFQA